jgi:hypothetical protein
MFTFYSRYMFTFYSRYMFTFYRRGDPAETE